MVIQIQHINTKFNTNSITYSVIKDSHSPAHTKHSNHSRYNRNRSNTRVTDSE